MQWTRKSGFELHPEGVFEADFVEWAEEYSETFQKDQIKLTFDTEALMNDGSPYRISKWVIPSLHPKAGMFGFLRALGIDPDEIEEGTEIDEVLDEIVASPRRRCQIVVKHYEGRDKQTKHKITDFLPLKKKGGKATSNGQAGNAQPRAEATEVPVGATEPPTAAAVATKKKLWADNEE